MDTHETIKEIKARFRLYMNGTASRSMRREGLAYKLNFGVELPRLREIAACYPADHALAQALWKEDVRECKILAGILQPAETFLPEMADIWIAGMHTPEMAELTCMNLFQRLPYAPEKAFEWMAAEGDYFQLCGYMLMARLLMRGDRLDGRAEDEFLDQALTALQDEAPLPRRAAAAALKKFALQGDENARKAIRLLAPLLRAADPRTASLAEEIKSETEYGR